MNNRLRVILFSIGILDTGVGLAYIPQSITSFYVLISGIVMMSAVYIDIEYPNRKERKPHSIKVDVGQSYVDKEWGDTILRITQLSKNGNSCRYVFCQVKGKQITDSYPEDMSIDFLLKTYKIYAYTC